MVEEQHRKRQRGRRARRMGQKRAKRNGREGERGGERATRQPRESNRNRVKCSRVKPCRGTTSITCGGFVTATFSATFQRAASPLRRHHRIVLESSFVRALSEKQRNTNVTLKGVKERFASRHRRPLRAFFRHQTRDTSDWPSLVGHQFPACVV